MAILDVTQEYFISIVAQKKFLKLLLTGEGGTGKTWALMTAIKSWVCEGKKILICAPTHTAKNILKNKLPPEIKNFVTIKTVASALGKFKFLTDGESAYASPTDRSILGYDLIAIDEVSMLSQRDLDIFLNCDAHVIATGDPFQIPVVKQKRPNLRIFSEYPTDEYQHLHLTDQKRQIGVIHALAQKARARFYMPQVEDRCDHIHTYLSPTELVDSYINSLNVDNVLDYRYLCYQVKEADYICNRVRSHIYETTEPYIAGESVILGESYGNIGDTGDIVKISDVSPVYIERGTFTGKLRDLTLKVYKLNISGTEVYTFDRDMWGYITNLHKSYVDEIKELKKHNHTESAFNLIYEIKDINDMFIKLNYIYASTVHKAQGASIENVYVNTFSLRKAPNKRALMYVSLSRAISNIHILVS